MLFDFPKKVLTYLSGVSIFRGEYTLADPKISHDVFGLAASLMLLYGLDDLALIE